jgi:dTDP-4-dehydrorhamnose 3,5-epimerase
VGIGPPCHWRGCPGEFCRGASRTFPRRYPCCYPQTQNRGLHAKTGHKPLSHHHGHLTEVFRADWGLTEAPIVQVNVTTTFPDRIRAWGIHRLTVDRLFAATGSLCIVCYDGRRGSPTFGCVNEFMLGERNQGLIVIPPGVYHGWKNIGADEATIVSMPSELYDHDGPDRWELPWDSDAARRIIPYQWP